MHDPSTVIVLCALLAMTGCDQRARSATRNEATVAGGAAKRTRALPAPRRDGGMGLDSVLEQRRSIRKFASRALTDAELGQLLWAGQGITSPHGYRTAPSAGALYPLTLEVADAGGLWRYQPKSHSLALVARGDRRSRIADAALRQAPLYAAPVIIAVIGRPAVTEPRYGGRARRFVAIEAGHAAQNILLEAVALRLGAVPIGGYDDAKVGAALSLQKGDVPLYLIAVGTAQGP